MRSIIRTAALAISVFALAACGSSEPTRTSPTADAANASLVITSSGFVDGGALPASAKANAFGGQCTGQNVSPELSWSGAPDGTVAYAITMLDSDALDFVHWTKTDIPSSITTIPSGGADAVEGAGGRTGMTSGTYFGPCPPSPDHHYVFTVYALDAPLSLQANYSIDTLKDALAQHSLAEASITGVAGPST